MGPDDPVAEQVAEFMACGKFYADAIPHGVFLQMPGITISSCGGYAATFNAAAITEALRGTADLEQRMDAATRFYTGRDLRWAFLVCDGLSGALTPAQVAEVFARRGLEPIWEITPMIAEDLANPVRELPAFDRIEPVKDENSRERVLDINAKAYDVAEKYFEEVVRCEALWKSPHLGYVGWAEGRAVSTAATFTRPAAVAVYWVATLPEYQGRGYAEALVRYALAQTGRARTLLQASPAGYPLYERMGYRPVTKFTYYAIPSNA